MEGGRPLTGAGRIELLPLDAEQGAPLLANVDEQGGFEVYLSTPRAFRARLVLPERRLRVQIGQIGFIDTEEILEVAVPAGAIGGVVVDPAKQPVEGAAVRATKPTESSGPPQEHRTQTDPQGRFELPMLTQGTWRVVAETVKGRSRPEEIILSPDERRLGLTLTLEGVRELRGRLVDEAGAPIANARVLLAAPNARGELEGAERRSLADGTFSFRVDATPAGRSTLLVQRDGGPVDLRFVSSPSDAELTLQVGSALSRLRLPPGGRPEEWVVQAADGAWLHWPIVAGEAGGDPRMLRLKPGVWSVKNLSGTSVQNFQLGPGDDQVVVVE
jgi:hypothetical protein